MCSSLLEILFVCLCSLPLSPLFFPYHSRACTKVNDMQLRLARVRVTPWRRMRFSRMLSVPFIHASCGIVGMVRSHFVQPHRRWHALRTKPRGLMLPLRIVDSSMVPSAKKVSSGLRRNWSICSSALVRPDRCHGCCLHCHCQNCSRGACTTLSDGCFCHLTEPFFAVSACSPI